MVPTEEKKGEAENQHPFCFWERSPGLPVHLPPEFLGSINVNRETPAFDLAKN